MFAQLLVSAAVFAAGVSAHGRVTSPTPRPLGTAMEEACGQQVYNQMASDPNGNIQAMAQTGASQSDYDATACHLWQCRGYQFADATTSSIQSYTAGETIDFTVDISAPHTGVANVSVINLAENTVIDQLAYWSVYASVATGVTANETSFSVTLPSDLPSTCATSGGCALQWWWNAESINQTYMSCIDFVVGSSDTTTSGSTSSSAAAAGSSTSSATSASAATSTVQASASSAPTTLSTVVKSSSASAATAAASQTTSAAAGSSSTSCTTDVTVTVTAKSAAVATSSASTSCTTDSTTTVTVKATSSSASSAKVTAAAVTASDVDDSCSVEYSTATATVYST